MPVQTTTRVTVEKVPAPIEETNAVNVSTAARALICRAYDEAPLQSVCITLDFAERSGKVTYPGADHMAEESQIIAWFWN